MKRMAPSRGGGARARRDKGRRDGKSRTSGKSSAPVNGAGKVALPLWKSSTLCAGIPEYTSPAHDRKKQLKRPKTAKWRNTRGEHGDGGAKDFPGKGAMAFHPGFSGNISVQTSADDFCKSYELNVLKKILQREKLVEDAAAMCKQKKSRGKALSAIQAVARCSVLVVEAISKWRSTSNDDVHLPFIYGGVNYLFKIVDDLNFVSMQHGMENSLAKILGHDPLTFSMERNPFLTRDQIPFLPTGAAAEELTPRKLTEALRQPAIISGGTGIAGVDDDTDALLEEGYIPSIEERRVHAAQQVLLLEEAYFATSEANTLATKAIRHDKGLDVPKSKSERSRLRMWRREKEAREMKEQNEEKKQVRIAASMVSPRITTTRVGVGVTVQGLPPLTEADIRALRGSAKGKLERMERDIGLCSVAIDKLEKASKGIENKKRERLSRLSRTQRERGDVCLRVLQDLNIRSNDIAKKLRYRRIELEQKKLAKHVYVQSKVDALNLQINLEIDAELGQFHDSSGRSGGCSRAFLTPLPATSPQDSEVERAIWAARDAVTNASEELGKAAAKGNTEEIEAFAKTAAVTAPKLIVVTNSAPLLPTSQLLPTSPTLPKSKAARAMEKKARARVKATRIIARDCVRNFLDVACGHVALRMREALETDMEQWRRTREEGYQVEMEAVICALKQEKLMVQAQHKARVLELEQEQCDKLEQIAQLEREAVARVEREAMELKRKLEAEEHTLIAEERAHSAALIIHAVAMTICTAAVTQATINHLTATSLAKPEQAYCMLDMEGLVRPETGKSRSSSRVTANSTARVSTARFITRESTDFLTTTTASEVSIIDSTESANTEEKTGKQKRRAFSVSGAALSGKKLKKKGAVFKDDGRELSDGWSRVFSRSKQKEYFFNKVSGISVWTLLDVPGALSQAELQTLAVGLKRKQHKGFKPSAWVTQLLSEVVETT